MIETEYQPEYDQKCLCANAPIEGMGREERNGGWEEGEVGEKKSRARSPHFFGKKPRSGLCVASPTLPSPPQQVYSVYGFTSTRVDTGFSKVISDSFQTHSSAFPAIFCDSLRSMAIRIDPWFLLVRAVFGT